MVVGNPDLKPETALSYELGTAYQDASWGAGITAFDNQIEDMIQSQSWKTNPWRACPHLSEHQPVRLRGIEFMPWVDVTQNVKLDANYTLVKAKDETTGLELLQTPSTPPT